MPAFLLGQSEQRRPDRQLCLGLRWKTDRKEVGQETCCNHRDGRMMSIMASGGAIGEGGMNTDGIEGSSVSEQEPPYSSLVS